MALPTVRLFLLGGTITMKKLPGKNTSLTSFSGVVPTVNADDLCRAVPGLDQVARLVARTDHMIASGNLNFQHAFDLAAEIRRAARTGDTDGFVIVQGTDTLEEMAFILDCLLDIPQPVVVTGAMRSPAELSADGPANIMAAVTCAADKTIGKAGVVVVMNDEIHGAAFVTKAHTASVGAFQSPNIGPIGHLAEGQPYLLSVPVQGPKFALPAGADMPKVALIKAAFGDDAFLLNMLETSECQGLVIEAFGAGHLPESYLATLDNMTGKIPVILCSRTGAGHIYQHTYGYKGAEMDLIKRGLIPSGIYNGLQSRLLLTLLLMSGAGHDDIKKTFAI
ncbi:L-asparaginase [hydrothermal vent metagenome]|uniref:L-asparaginase n=1 Tax=hydrothermal vent metagenome TaxID=652676 RepID=A0A3B1AUA5_9ZZZZ